MSVGHRYWCLSVLASYGIKCDIPEDEVLTDAMELLPMFDNISDDEHNRFTKRDVLDAMNMYQENYVTYSRAEVERVSGISVPPNKRNGRKQATHLKIARNTLSIMNEDNGEVLQGRPDKAKVVEEWRKVHPDGKKADCVRDTGLDKKTVYKWWDGEAASAVRKVSVKKKGIELNPVKGKWSDTDLKELKNTEDFLNNMVKMMGAEFVTNMIKDIAKTENKGETEDDN